MTTRSTASRRHLAFCLALAAAMLGVGAEASAQSAGDLLLTEWKPGQWLDAETSTYLDGSRKLDNDESARLTLTRSYLRARLSDKREVNPTLGIQSTHLELNGNSVLPRQLDDLNASLASPLFGEENWFVGASLGGGYAGSNAFGDGNALYVLASVTYGRQFDNGDQLLFLLDYDGNRVIFPDLPIPSVAYRGSPRPEFKYTLGFPYADVEFRPTQQWRISLGYSFPVNATAEVGFRPVEEVEVFARFVTDEDAFHVDALSSDRRLFYEESRAELGVTWEVAEFIKLTGAGGYAFERSFSTGYDDRDLHHVASMEDGPFARLGLTLTF